MSKERAKGTLGENGAVDYLAENGFPHVERRALAGINDKGDVAGIPGIVIEVKNHKSYKFPQWMKETQVEKDNANADFGILVVKPNGVGVSNSGKWWAVMTLEDMANLLRDAGYGTPRKVVDKDYGQQ